MQVADMQPLISPIDHESRESYHTEDESAQGASEWTPLLYYRFPTPITRNSLTTVFVVGCLMFVLLTGLTIGLYLLILQSNSENILPPVENKVHFIPRADWDKVYSPKAPLALVNVPTFKADCVVVHQTDSRTCEEIDDCSQLIRELKADAGKQPLPFSFLISSEGYIFEYLGLDPTDYIPDRASLVLGFIGNYTHVPPTKEQIQAAKRLIDESVLNDRLDEYYTIIGKDKDELKYLLDNPQTLINEVDSLMFVILTRMYKNITEAMEHM